MRRSRGRVPVERLTVGDRFVVRPGEKVGTDGIGRGRPLRGRPEHAHRRVGPGRGRPRGDEVAGATVNARRTADRRCDAHRRGTRCSRRSRAWSPRRRPARRRCNGSPTASPASSCRSCSRSPWAARLLARCRRERDVRLHVRRRRADHRVPVRPRPRHADGADGRNRPRRAARAARRGAGDPRVDPPRGHDRARQDRHDHDRTDVARVHVAMETTRKPCGWLRERWSTSPSTRWRGPSPRRWGTGTTPRGSRTSATTRDSACHGVVAGPARARRTAVVEARRADERRRGWRSRKSTEKVTGAAARRQTPSSRRPPRRWPSSRRSGCVPSC